MVFDLNLQFLGGSLLIGLTGSCECECDDGGEKTEKEIVIFFGSCQIRST